MRPGCPSWSFLSLVHVADSWRYSGCLVFVIVLASFASIASFASSQRSHRRSVHRDVWRRGGARCSHLQRPVFPAHGGHHGVAQSHGRKARGVSDGGAAGAGGGSREGAETREMYAFKRKGNEEQAEFNAKVDETAAEAEAELMEAGTSAAPALQRALDAVRKGRQLMAERQKLIKIADRSEHGWGVVAEYTTDELAEGSDDEKRLEKAERAAEVKAAKRRKKRGGGVAAQRPAPPPSSVGRGCTGRRAAVPAHDHR